MQSLTPSLERPDDRSLTALAPRTPSLMPGASAKVERSASGSRRPTKPVLGLAGILTFLLIWELTPRIGLVDAPVLPGAPDFLATLVGDRWRSAFRLAVGETLLAWILGLTIAIVLAMRLGFIIGSSPLLQKYTNLKVEFLRSIRALQRFSELRHHVYEQIQLAKQGQQSHRPAVAQTSPQG